MRRLILVRHGQSVWNLENIFTGWTDVELSPNGIKEAEMAGKALLSAGIGFDAAFVSYLKRAIETSSGNMYIQRGIYRRLLDLSQEKNDYKNATIYGNKLIECQDSIYLLDKSKEIVEIQEKYNPII